MYHISGARMIRIIRHIEVVQYFYTVTGMLNLLRVRPRKHRPSLGITAVLIIDHTFKGNDSRSGTR